MAVADPSCLELCHRCLVAEPVRLRLLTLHALVRQLLCEHGWQPLAETSERDENRACDAAVTLWTDRLQDPVGDAGVELRTVLVLQADAPNLGRAELSVLVCAVPTLDGPMPAQLASRLLASRPALGSILPSADLRAALDDRVSSLFTALQPDELTANITELRDALTRALAP